MKGSLCVHCRVDSVNANSLLQASVWHGMRCAVWAARAFMYCKPGICIYILRFKCSPTWYRKVHVCQYACMLHVHRAIVIMMGVEGVLLRWKGTTYIL